MKLLVGLGNPGRKYGATRHNIGFMIVDAVARLIELEISKEKFSSFFGIGKINENDVCIIKPQTFMNVSGHAVAEFAHYYKLEVENVLVVHDDMDMELGKLKIVKDSGAGGHNGVASIIDNLGTKSFWRLKIGIGRPQVEIDPSDHVLMKFSKGEREIVREILKTSSDAVMSFFKDGAEKAMQRYNNTLVFL